MLKKIGYYYDEDHEKMDISDEKIYWDTKKNQFRVKFYCNDCKRFIDCRCFDSLFIARNQIEEGMICNDCGFKYYIDEESLTEIVYILDDERVKKVNRFAIGKLTRSELMKLVIDNTNNNKSFRSIGISLGDIIEFLELDDRENEVKDYAIGLFTEDEKEKYFQDNCDEWANGESCNI